MVIRENKPEPIYLGKDGDTVFVSNPFRVFSLATYALGNLPTGMKFILSRNSEVIYADSCYACTLMTIRYYPNYDVAHTRSLLYLDKFDGYGPKSRWVSADSFERVKKQLTDLEEWSLTSTYHVHTTTRWDCKVDEWVFSRTPTRFLVKLNGKEQVFDHEYGVISFFIYHYFDQLGLGKENFEIKFIKKT